MMGREFAGFTRLRKGHVAPTGEVRLLVAHLSLACRAILCPMKEKPGVHNKLAWWIGTMDDVTAAENGFVRRGFIGTRTPPKGSPDEALIEVDGFQLFIKAEDEAAIEAIFDAGDRICFTVHSGSVSRPTLLPIWAEGISARRAPK